MGGLGFQNVSPLSESFLLLLLLLEGGSVGGGLSYWAELWHPSPLEVGPVMLSFFLASHKSGLSEEGSFQKGPFSFVERQRGNGQRGNGPKSSERFSEIFRGFSEDFRIKFLIQNGQESAEKC